MASERDLLVRSHYDGRRQSERAPSDLAAIPACPVYDEEEAAVPPTQAQRVQTQACRDERRAQRKQDSVTLVMRPTPWC